VLVAGRQSDLRAVQQSSREKSPRWTRMMAALLALEVTWVHVLDQGGVFALRDPPYVGWGYRFLELGGVLVAIWLLSRWYGWLSWLMAAGIAVGPLTGYIASRSVGLPNYRDDVGNWFEPLGILAVIAEFLLLVLATTALVGLRRRGDPAPGDDLTGNS
jgi:hypothetical protein